MTKVEKGLAELEVYLEENSKHANKISALDKALKDLDFSKKEIKKIKKVMTLISLQRAIKEKTMKSIGKVFKFFK